ncbi:monooxygenase [Microdochium trichocladiopsis]|uniref:Monooxygenase n=1 Tax=Microdochium trichocladiopsis TaxID=1682393 RepID=A0A9P8YM28_9PEZI|nr:monooxygenase [Microdochium trichocladiopsis]KAH7041529.1 monooxygenase [Microdochium trichocladiopsis]
MLPQSLLLALGAASTAAASVIPRQNGTTCTNPVVRKEWRELTDAEKAEYLRAAVCVRNLPKQKYSQIEAVTTRMDDLVYTHFSLNLDIHFVANFLPWHRWFLHLHENLLRDECGFKGVQPYWDWSIEADSRTMPESPIWDAATGFGGNGVKTGNPTPGFQRCVVDGPFANTNLTLAMGWPDMNTVGNRLHCFTREFNSAEGHDPVTGEIIIGDMQVSAYSSAVMRTIDNFDTYRRMSEMLEGLPHAQIHSVIFGDMGPATSPNEPLFFLHHANVDRAWARWQGRNATRLADYAGFIDRDETIRASITDEMPVMELADTKPVVQDYMDTMAGPLCYTYSKMTL